MQTRSSDLNVAQKQESRRLKTVGFLLFVVLGCNARADDTSLAQGNQAFRTGDYELALHHYSQLEQQQQRQQKQPQQDQATAESNRDDALLHFNMGIAYARLGRLDEAEH